MSGCVVSSPQIALSYTGTPQALTAVPILSPQPGNGLLNLSDGMYAPGIVDLEGGDFPATPYDGMVVKTTSISNVAWTFRYNPLSTVGSKWEYVGGGDHHVDIETSGVLTPSQPSGTFGAWGSLPSDPGPDFVAPFTGTYVIDFGVTVDPINGEIAQAGLRLVSGDPASDDIVSVGSALTSSGARGQQKVLNAGDLVRMVYRSTGTGTATFRRRWMNIRPVRCGGARAAGTYGGT